MKMFKCIATGIGGLLNITFGLFSIFVAFKCAAAPVAIGTFLGGTLLLASGIGSMWVSVDLEKGDA